MKGFLIKSLIFSFVILLILSLRLMILPYYYGSEIYTSKIEYYNRHTDDYNAVIFGSSRMHHHFNPRLFGKIVTEEKISAYNFGIPAAFNPEAYYLFENFIETVDSTTVKYAFLELQNIAHHRGYIKSSRGGYWCTSDVLTYCHNHLDNANSIENDRKEKLRADFNNSFIKRWAGTINVVKLLNKKPYSSGNDGFFSLTSLYNNAKKGTRVRKRFENFIADTSGLENRILAIRQKESMDVSKMAVNPAHFAYIEKFIRQCKEKGIHLFVILPPTLLIEHYQNLTPLLYALPEGHIIDIPKYRYSQKLHTTACSFDLAHFNKRGANIYTRYLARSVNRMIKKTKKENKHKNLTAIHTKKKKCK